MATITDDFNRANGGLGANWATVTGNAASIVSNAVVGPSVTSTDDGAVYDAVSFGTDMYAQVDATKTSGVQDLAVAVRCDPSVFTCYQFTWASASGGQWMLWRVVNGVFTAVTTGTTGIGNTGTRTLRLEIEGTTLRGYSNGVQVITGTDASITTQSRGGLGFFQTTVGTHTFDNFETGDLPIAPSHSNTTSATNTGTVARPTGSGGRLILSGGVYDDGSVVVGDASPPSGDWELLSFVSDPTAHNGTIGPVASWVWTKPADAGDPANFEWTETTDGTYLETTCSRYTHPDGIPSVNAVATPTGARTTNGEVPALTTTVDGCTIYAVRIAYGSTVTVAPSGYTQRAVFDSVNYVWDRTVPIAGTYGPTSYTTGSDDQTNHAIALGPASAAPDAVDDLSGTAGDTEVVLDWTAPDDGGSSITDYLIEYAANAIPAFPTIPTGGRVVTGVQANTTATRTFPSLSGLTKNAGDLLIAICVGYQTSTGTDAAFSSWGGGFSEFHDSATSTTMAIGCAYKWSTGSETGTFTVTQAGTITGHAAFILLSIPGAHASTPPEAGGRNSSTNATMANPTSVNPSGWGTENTLWIAVAGDGETSTTGSYTAIASGPANYTDYAQTGISSDVVGGVEAAVAFRQLVAASEDAGEFTADTSNARHAAILIAVRPATAPWQSFSDGTSTDTDATVTGLVNDTPYYFQVAPVNVNGQGAWSNVAGPYTPEASGAAGPTMKRWNGSAWTPVVLKHGASWDTVVLGEL